MAGNIDNLVKNEDRTPEERRKNATKAGKASGVARKRKKELKELLMLALSQPQTDDPSTDNYMGITVALINKALNGDVKAFETIRDTIGQKPIEQQEVGLSAKIEIDYGED